MGITKKQITARAERLGFSFISFTHPKQTPHFQDFFKLVNKYKNTKLDFLSKPYVIKGRKDPSSLLDNAQSILILGINYPYEQSIDIERLNNNGVISSYAVIPDYHSVIRKKTEQLLMDLQQIGSEPIRSRIFIDSGPMMEKDMAFMAGAGWIGKNTVFIHPTFGSFVFLCCVITDIKLRIKHIKSNDLCGACNQCVAACPTKCIHDHQIDPFRCISYLTIEHEGIIPRHLRNKIGNRVFGCDICQIVCPHNQTIEIPKMNRFFGINKSFSSLISISQSFSLNQKTFKEVFAGSPIERIGHERFLRNVVIAAGNNKEPDCIDKLKNIFRDSSDFIRIHTAWALNQYQKPEITKFLDEQIAKGVNKLVEKEIRDTHNNPVN